MAGNPHEPVLGARGSALREPVGWIDGRDLAPTLDKVRRLSMVSRTSLVDLARQVRAVLMYEIPGDLVECGVWRGGASFLMAELLRQARVGDRRVWMFDSFEGLPVPEEIDGLAAAAAYARNRESSQYGRNGAVSLEDVRQSARDLGLDSYVEMVKGWFEQTLPANRDRIGRIAILRIDCDWYSGVRSCLENLYDQVADGGFVILDDYYAFEGCAIAVHEFLAERRLAHRLEGVIGNRLPAVFRKGPTTWYEARRWMRYVREVDLAMEELASVVPRGEAFVLVDGDELGTDAVVAGRRRIPFLERDGQYWGEPADDETAIEELERLRRLGASYLVFAWPAFWWLSHYSGLRKHIRGRFPRVLGSKRVRVFDIRAARRPGDA